MLGNSLLKCRILNLEKALMSPTGNIIEEQKNRLAIACKPLSGAVQTESGLLESLLSILLRNSFQDFNNYVLPPD